MRGYWVNLAHRGGPWLELSTSWEYSGYPDQKLVRIAAKCGLVPQIGFNTRMEPIHKWVDVWGT